MDRSTADETKLETAVQGYQNNWIGWLHHDLFLLTHGFNPIMPALCQHNQFAQNYAGIGVCTITTCKVTVVHASWCGSYIST